MISDVKCKAQFILTKAMDVKTVHSVRSFDLSHCSSDPATTPIQSELLQGKVSNIPVYPWIWTAPERVGQQSTQARYYDECSDAVKRFASPWNCARYDAVIEGQHAKLWQIHAEVKEIIGCESDLPYLHRGFLESRHRAGLVRQGITNEQP